MFQKFLRLLLLLFCFSCKEQSNKIQPIFKSYDESAEIEQMQTHKKEIMRFKRIQSKYKDMNAIFKPFQKALSSFSEEYYQRLKPFIIEKTIPEIQQSIKDKKLTYKALTLFYLYRIRTFESDTTKYLNAIISLNPNIIKQAEEKDNLAKHENIPNNSVFGMPILVKDNIDTSHMATTAGAMALKNNVTTDAFIVKQLKQNGALILGKVNLSEWAYFFCDGCPIGYSALGGQTLNPYGRKKFETGGSSSASGVATAVNYAVATIGSETIGSITSPSGKNSVVGLKPTIGLLSRSGIIPISSTLDTPGPMTKWVVDNHILLKAMMGKDPKDQKSFALKITEAEKNLQQTNLKSKRFGVYTELLEDSLYNKTIAMIKNTGAEIVKINPKNVTLDGLLSLLNIDMKYDLENYLSDKKLNVKSVKDVINFNLKDTENLAPYGQELFEGIINDTTSLKTLKTIKTSLKQKSLDYFKIFDTQNLDAILSIDNYHSVYSALAEYPNLTLPMGYTSQGEPKNITLIGIPNSEFELLNIGQAFEQLGKIRKLPRKYE